MFSEENKVPWTLFEVGCIIIWTTVVFERDNKIFLIFAAVCCSSVSFVHCSVWEQWPSAAYSHMNTAWHLWVHATAGSPVFSPCLSVPFSWTWYLRNSWREILQPWHKHPLGFFNEVIRFWLSKVKGHCAFREQQNARSQTQLWQSFPRMLNATKWWRDDIWHLKGQSFAVTS